MDGILAERGHHLVAHRGQRALWDVLADQVDRGDQRLGLDRQQAGGARERVPVRLGIDLDHPVGTDLGVEDVGAGAEVDDVEHRDVLAQLLIGDPQLACAARRASRRRPARPASIRMLASVTSRANRSGRIAASGWCPLPVSGSVRSAVQIRRRRRGCAGRRRAARPCGARPAARRGRAAPRQARAGSRIRACSPRPSTQAISWRALAYDVTNTRSPSSSGGCISP